MSLSSYTDIKGAIADWLARDDLADRIPDFIVIAEQQIARRLKAVAMESITSTPIYAGQQYYSLPEQMTELRNLYVNTNPLTKLSYRTPEQLITENPYQTGSIRTYTIVDNQIKLGSNAEGDGSITTDSLVTSYWRRFDPLTEDNQTNWLTEEAPDLLLYGALVSAEGYLGADARIQQWKSQFDELIQTISRREDRKRFSGDTLEIRSSTNGSFRQPLGVR